MILEEKPVLDIGQQCAGPEGGCTLWVFGYKGGGSHPSGATLHSEGHPQESETDGQCGVVPLDWGEERRSAQRWQQLPGRQIAALLGRALGRRPALRHLPSLCRHLSASPRLLSAPPFRITAALCRRAEGQHSAVDGGGRGPLASGRPALLFPLSLFPNSARGSLKGGEMNPRTQPRKSERSPWRRASALRCPARPPAPRCCPSAYSPFLGTLGCFPYFILFYF